MYVDDLPERTTNAEAYIEMFELIFFLTAEKAFVFFFKPAKGIRCERPKCAPRESLNTQ